MTNTLNIVDVSQALKHLQAQLRTSGWACVLRIYKMSLKDCDTMPKEKLYLVYIKFDIYKRHSLVHTTVMLQDTVHSFWNILHY